MDGMQQRPVELVQLIQKLEQENKELKEELKRIREEFDEYKKRHTPTVGVKNGKPYAFKPANQSPTPNKPGAKQVRQPVNGGASRPR
jgi:TolA-binding protein